MSTYNIGFYEDFAKIIYQISSNTHLIFSSDPTVNTEQTLHVYIQNGEFIPNFVPKSSLARFWYLTANLQVHVKYECA